MATEYKIENRILYIYLDGDLDHHLAKKVKHKCDIILKSYPIKDIEFDFKNSGFIDSSGIGVILGRYRQVQAMGGTVKVSNMSASVRKIIHMAGLHQLIEETYRTCILRCFKVCYCKYGNRRICSGL